MHIAHEELAQSFGECAALRRSAFELLHPPGDAVAHTSRCTVGKRKTGHVLKGYALPTCPYDSFGQHGRLATSRRSQHQMATARCLDHLLLLFVEFHRCFYLFCAKIA